MSKKMRAQTLRKFQQAMTEILEPRQMMSVYTVNTISDAVTTPPGLLTLRQAVADANTNPGANTINFDPMVFAASSLHTIMLARGTLFFTDTNGTTVNGPGPATLEIDGNGFSAVQIAQGANSFINGVTITNGRCVSSAGATAAGAGITVLGALTLNNTVITGNTATGGAATSNSNRSGGSAEGAGIYSVGSLTLIHSTVSDNTATAGTSYHYDGGSAAGAGIYATGPLTITGSTISDNTATGGDGTVSSDRANGGDADGGGVYATFDASIMSSTVTGNTAIGGATTGDYSAGASGDADGGGLFLAEASSITGSTITNNSATGGGGGQDSGSSGAGSGGGVYAQASLTISTSNISENVARATGYYDGDEAAGGGVFARGDVSVIQSQITDNALTAAPPELHSTALSGAGGGLYTAGSFTIEQSTVSANSVNSLDPAYGSQGAIDVGGGVASLGGGTILGSTISGNIAAGGAGYTDVIHDYLPRAGGDGMGGGVYSAGDLTITNSTIANDRAAGGTGGGAVNQPANGEPGGGAIGGGIYSTISIILADSSVTGNTTIGGEGGVANEGTPYMNGSPGISLGGGIALGSGTISLSNSIIDANTSGSSAEDDIDGSVTVTSDNNLVGAGGTLANGVHGNIVGINNPQLEPLGNYGGPTQTELPLPGSPAINAGSNSAIPNGITTDQRGDARIVGSAVDIGADESEAGPVSGTVYNDLNGDGVHQTGEPGLAGVTIYADLSNAGTYMAGDPTAVTNSSGNYTLNGLPEGAVVIRQELPTGYRQSYPIGGAGDHVTVTAAAVIGALFADTTDLYVSGSVTYNGVSKGNVLVYADLNHDGQFEINENNKLTTTGGTFAFESLPAGTYSFRIVAPSGEVQSSPANNAGIIVTLGNGGVDQDLAFALVASTTKPVTGNVIGTSGSYNNQGNTAANAFDGNLNTYFDAPTASGSWAGLNLGSPQVITQLSYAPRSGWASRMVGGMFQGSNSPSFLSGVVTLYTVTGTSVTGVLATVSVSNATAFQYVRYIGPTDGYCNVAEVDFFGHAPTAATLANGVLSVAGTTGADTITISLTPASDIVTVNGVTHSFVPAQVQSIIVTTLDGNDTVSITGNDSTGTQNLPTVSVQSGNGNDMFTENLNGDGSGNDPGAFVTIVAGNGNDSFNISGSSINASVTAGNGSDTFATTISGSGNMHATLNAGDGNDAMTAGRSGGLGSEEIVFNAGIGVDTLLNTDEDDYISGTLGGQTYSLIPAEQELVGNVYQDQNGDGKYEAGAPLASDATVTFNNSTDGTFGTVTDSTGHYSLNVYYNGSAAPVTTYGWTSPIMLNSQNGQGELISGVDFALAKPLAGTIIGTAGSYNNQGNTAASAFDGNLSTDFDAPVASGSWAGLNLETPEIISQISYAPRSGWASRMVDGIFQASDTANFSNDVVNLYTVTSTPVTGVLTTVQITDDSAYQYVRYIGPAGGYCNIAEAQFVGMTPVTGATLEANGTLVINGTQGADAIAVAIDLHTDGDGDDTITATVNASVQTFAGSLVDGLVINDGNGKDTITVEGQYEGGGGADDPTTDALATTINAGNGNDSITASVYEFNDAFFNGPPDVVNLGSGSDSVDLEQDGSATVTGGAGSDTVTANSDDGDNLDFIGASETDTLQSQAPSGGYTVELTGPTSIAISTFIALSTTENINVTGTNGNDFISVRANTADITTGSGDNTVYVNAKTSATVTGGGGNDTIDASDSAGVVIINGGGGTNTAYTTSNDIVTNVQILNPKSTAPFGGTLMATTGSYQNGGNTASKVFDGNLATYFDGPTASGDYVGLDLGSFRVIGSIAYAPRLGWAQRMVGGTFESSDTPDFSMPQYLFTITTAPMAGEFTTYSLPDPIFARYIRYVAPDGSFGDVAEIEFLPPGVTAAAQLSGTALRAVAKQF